MSGGSTVIKHKQNPSHSGIRHIALAGLLAVTGAAFAQEAPQAREDKPGADRYAILKTSTCRSAPYPMAALRDEAEGKVTVSFLIGTDGRVHDAAVSRSSGRRELDESALRALSQCVFEPAIVDGKPAEEKSSLQYVFSLGGLLPTRY